MHELRFVWARITNDVNGNPRYRVHHHAMIPDLIRMLSENYRYPVNLDDVIYDRSRLLKVAQRRAKKIGGKLCRLERYPYDIVFQSYNLTETEASIRSQVPDDDGIERAMDRLWCDLCAVRSDNNEQTTPAQLWDDIRGGRAT